MTLHHACRSLGATLRWHAQTQKKAPVNHCWALRLGNVFPCTSHGSGLLARGGRRTMQVNGSEMCCPVTFEADQSAPESPKRIEKQP
eukprot:3199884-Pyramimonas_sp.AAC.1